VDGPPTPLLPLSSQPAHEPWPTRAWRGEEDLPPPPAELVDAGWDDLLHDAASVGETWALVLVQGGRLVAEGYAAGRTPDQTVRSWSAAKSVLHAAVGLLHHEGRLGPTDRIAAPEWPADDERQAITVEHALRMEDGLRWREDYEQGATGSDVQEMLFGAGKPDVGAYVAARPLAHPPGTVHGYSSGTSNLLSRRVAQVVGPGAPYQRWVDDRLFGPLGMRSALLRLDHAGTWVASSYVFATPRDLARFGLLYLRDGTWEGTRLLPEGWVDHARTASPVSGTERYGAHWWVHDDPYGTFAAQGHRTQRILVSPALDSVLVRIGDTPPEQAEAVDQALRRILDAVAASGG
jgi:CubicO group peptidase (beta-lactamase class C family)